MEIVTVDVDVLVIMAALIMFGTAYNIIVARMESSPGGHEGFTAFLVVCGVAMTVLLLWPLLGTQAVVYLTVGFACSGAPMIIGSIHRYIAQRACSIRELRSMSRMGDDEA